jgi:hypothetical protein
MWDAWCFKRQPLLNFSKTLNLAQQKYRANDRELLAIYGAVKHFRHVLEARHFIFTDHKPITYAFQHVRHISGHDNVVADALSHVESVTASPSCVALAASQDCDDELQTLMQSNTTRMFCITTINICTEI